MTASVVSRRFVEGGWRATKYQRADGSTFEVAIPRTLAFCADGSYSVSYDESSEASMRDLLNARGGPQ